MEPASPAPEQGSEAAAPMSLGARLFNIFATPGDVFDEVAVAPPATANWLLPTLLACVIGVTAVLVLFSQPAILQQVRDQQDQVIQKQVAAGKMTKAQAEQAGKLMERIGPLTMKIGGCVGAVVGGFVWLFVLALVLWLLGRWVMKGDFSYLKAVEVAGLSGMIACLGAIVTTLLAVAQGKLGVTLGPALFLQNFDPLNKTHQLLAAVNVMTLWQIAVLALGLAKLSRASFARAAVLLYVLWAACRVALIFLSSLGIGGG